MRIFIKKRGFTRQNFFKKISGGFMVIEVLIAASIITASILAAMMVAQRSIYVSRQALHTTQAAFLLEEGAEAVRLLRDNGWSGISSLTVGSNYYPLFTGGAWTLSSTANTVGIFTRTVVVNNVNRDNATDDISTVGTLDAGTKLITVAVSWMEGSTTVSKNLRFYLANIFSE